MADNFQLPSNMLGKFAVVKLWPEIKTAEDECIARLKSSAKKLGLECVEIHPDGRFIDSPNEHVSKKNIDFAFHLHYDTPKFYDAFSFVALWNPTQFYHEWGYSRTSRNLLSHDDFISCGSQAANDHVNRLIRDKNSHLSPCFEVYHSISDVYHAPTLGDLKLFYAGINWDALRGGVSRHQDLLKRLDTSGHLRIYGPTIFQGVRVWKGYESYVREIPFDGVSMLEEISKAGIALVLSSQAHKDSELMSNRLFESIAAGAIIICDENKFAKTHFGSSLLYIDTRKSTDQIYSDIISHLKWIKNNQQEAISMIENAQSIFRKKFSLNHSLTEIYQKFDQRKNALSKHMLPEDGILKVRMYLLMQDYSDEVLRQHVLNVTAQEYSLITPVLLIDSAVYNQYKSQIHLALESANKNIICEPIDFYELMPKGTPKIRKKLGAVLLEALSKTDDCEVVIFVAPNERIFSNHINVLANTLQRKPETACAATAYIINTGNDTVHTVHDRIDFKDFVSNLPVGFGRFAFRIASLPKDLHIALPYVDRKVMAVLINEQSVSTTLPSTIVIDTNREFPMGKWDEGQENNVIASYSPRALEINFGKEILVPLLSSQSKMHTIVRGMKRFSWNWFQVQVNAIRRDGLGKRIGILRKRLQENKNSR